MNTEHYELNNDKRSRNFFVNVISINDISAVSKCLNFNTFITVITAFRSTLLCTFNLLFSDGQTSEQHSSEVSIGSCYIAGIV
jgi:hypothetical protein